MATDVILTEADGRKFLTRTMGRRIHSSRLVAMADEVVASLLMDDMVAELMEGSGSDPDEWEGCNHLIFCDVLALQAFGVVEYAMYYARAYGAYDAMRELREAGEGGMALALELQAWGLYPKTECIIAEVLGLARCHRPSVGASGGPGTPHVLGWAAEDAMIPVGTDPRYTPVVEYLHQSLRDNAPPPDPKGMEHAVLSYPYAKVRPVNRLWSEAHWREAIDRCAVINATTTSKADDMKTIGNEFNDGAINVLFANKKAYEGVDLQTLTCGLHHLDLPWEPGTYTQRNGRAVRQGSKRDVVQIHAYLTSGTVDYYRLGRMEGRRNWLESVMDGGRASAASGLTEDDIISMIVGCTLPAQQSAVRARLEARVAQLKRQRAQQKAGLIQAIVFGYIQLGSTLRCNSLPGEDASPYLVGKIKEAGRKPAELKKNDVAAIYTFADALIRTVRCDVDTKTVGRWTADNRSVQITKVERVRGGRFAAMASSPEDPPLLDGALYHHGPDHQEWYGRMGQRTGQAGAWDTRVGRPILVKQDDGTYVHLGWRWEGRWEERALVEQVDGATEIEPNFSPYADPTAVPPTLHVADFDSIFDLMETWARIGPQAAAAKVKEWFDVSYVNHRAVFPGTWPARYAWLNAFPDAWVEHHRWDLWVRIGADPDLLDFVSVLPYVTDTDYLHDGLRIIDTEASIPNAIQRSIIVWRTLATAFYRVRKLRGAKQGGFTPILKDPDPDTIDWSLWRSLTITADGVTVMQRDEGSPPVPVLYEHPGDLVKLHGGSYGSGASETRQRWHREIVVQVEPPKPKPGERATRPRARKVDAAEIPKLLLPCDSDFRVFMLALRGTAAKPSTAPKKAAIRVLKEWFGSAWSWAQPARLLSGSHREAEARKDKVNIGHYTGSGGSKTPMWGVAQMYQQVRLQERDKRRPAWGFSHDGSIYTIRGTAGPIGPRTPHTDLHTVGKGNVGFAVTDAVTGEDTVVVLSQTGKLPFIQNPAQAAAAQQQAAAAQALPPEAEPNDMSADLALDDEDER